MRTETTTAHRTKHLYRRTTQAQALVVIAMGLLAMFGPWLLCWMLTLGVIALSIRTSVTGKSPQGALDSIRRALAFTEYDKHHDAAGPVTPLTEEELDIIARLEKEIG